MHIHDILLNADVMVEKKKILLIEDQLTQELPFYHNYIENNKHRK